jgi:hypothetical protein
VGATWRFFIAAGLKIAVVNVRLGKRLIENFVSDASKMRANS